MPIGSVKATNELCKVEIVKSGGANNTIMSFVERTSALELPLIAK